jgi:hypothetical protein
MPKGINAVVKTAKRQIEKVRGRKKKRGVSAQLRKKESEDETTCMRDMRVS